jgi:hypothetical protein
MQFLSAEGSARIGEEIETIEMAIGFQRIAMQKTEDMEVLSGLLFCDNILLPHEESQGTSTHKIREKPGHQHCPSSRQPALVMREIPHLKIPAALQRGVKENGGKVYRIGIVCSHRNHYTIKIRCNTKKSAEHYDQLQPAEQLPHTDQFQSAVQSRNTDLTNTTGSLKCGGGP